MNFRPSTCLRLVGIGLLIWLLLGADWTTLGEIIARVEVTYLYVMPACTAALVAVRAWRWNILLASQGIPFTQWRACAAYASGIFLGTFTPGRLGDLSKALYVRQERDISWERALSGAVLDRLFDLLFMFCMAIWAVVHLDLLGAIRPYWVVIVDAPHVSGLVFALVLVAFLVVALVVPPLRRLGRVFGVFISSLRGECETLMRLVGWHAAALTGLAYAIYFAQTVALARGLNLPLGALDIIASIVLVGLASFLPLSVAGLGTREGGLALIMAHRAVPDSLEASLAYSALFFAFCFVVPGLLGFACFWHRPLSWQALRRSTSGLLKWEKTKGWMDI